MEDKIIFITGASSGIGWATAEAFSKRGAQLILCGRRKEKLEILARKLDVKTTILIFDVRDKKAVFDAIENLPENWKKIDILINNAGNAHGLDPVQTAKLEDWDAMIDGNVKGLMYVTKAVLPGRRLCATSHWLAQRRADRAIFRVLATRPRAGFDGAGPAVPKRRRVPPFQRARCCRKDPLWSRDMGTVPDDTAQPWGSGAARGARLAARGGAARPCA